MTVVNLVGYVVALLLAGFAVIAVGHPLTPVAAVVERTGAVNIEILPDGRKAIRDARGTLVALAEWKRIVALDLVSDELLGHLVEPRRITAVSTWAQGPEAWRHAGVPRLPGLTDLEAVIGLKPDLLLVSTFGGESDRIARLRDSGIAVFDLGQAGGLRELTANLRRIALLVGAPERGERLASQLEQRMAAVAARLPATVQRRRALILTPAGEQVYGGTTGTSYHDIVIAAGLSDAAEGRFAEPWPRIGAEQALAMDPEVIVTRSGASEALRRLPGFDRLRAVRNGAVIELPVELFDSPGLSMLDAAELLHLKAYP